MSTRVGGIDILLVDDHRLFREGVRAMLSSQPDFVVVADAEDGRSALDRVRELDPDIVIMDVSMPGLNGIDAARILRAERPHTRILALSMHVDLRFVRQLLASGVRGYVVKSCAAEDLFAAVRAVHEGRIWLSADVLDVMVDDYREHLDGDAVPDPLSPRERQVLQLVAEGYATKRIADVLNVSAKTVETHRRQIMDKLRIRTVAGLTKYALRAGLTSLD